MRKLYYIFQLLSVILFVAYTVFSVVRYALEWHVFPAVLYAVMATASIAMLTISVKELIQAYKR